MFEDINDYFYHSRSETIFLGDIVLFHQILEDKKNLEKSYFGFILSDGSRVIVPCQNYKTFADFQSDFFSLYSKWMQIKVKGVQNEK